ncbi:DEAD/DEAH box helicase [Corynebacterium frankenforstense]|uniref:DEAD/DEAH box helicase n=1 Tax=Corynebacterium TaxID=1716 RepID=UPI00254C1F0E|nr:MULTISPECIES: DEAD/DEAH box helicase [Corynebacterium]MDK6259005.1 DEAD/DEAH box helicase [Corynebacterium frankenforstense]MDK8894649.1 DEAD/DEAH box helicase [Corynebacterium sp. MSK006]
MSITENATGGENVPENVDESVNREDSRGVEAQTSENTRDADQAGQTENDDEKKEGAAEGGAEAAADAHVAEGTASESEGAKDMDDKDSVEQGAEQNDDATGAENKDDAAQDAGADGKTEDTSAKDAKSVDENDDTPGFEALSLPDDVVAAVRKVGFEQPSAIQQETIPLLMQGRDVVGLAQTGTGKTAAFALPILARIDRSQRHPQALILAPTRELALQVADSFQQFADHLGGIHILPIYGGQAYGIQLGGLRRGAHIIVGTPGRVIDHLERGSLDISNLRFLVLDEADEMLNMGFQEDVERILEDTPEHKQVALFSATMPNGIRRISKQYLDNPAEVTVKAETRTATNITQRWLHVAHRNKLDALTRILEVTEFEAMIIFVRTKSETEEVAEKLRARGFSAAAINGDVAQAQRERTVDQLRDGRLDILVATDVAARGLDVERISHVLNFDIPHDTESYVHRIGRTGRAGRTGEAILFVTPRERRMLRTIERVTNAPLAEMDLPTVDEVNESRKSRFADSITESLEDPQLELFRGLVKAYSEAHDTPLEDIAAALATQAQIGDEFLMKEPPKDAKRDRRDRRDRDRDRGDRRGRGRFEAGEGKAMYRISVGKRQHVRPGAIVGALANEGGLNSRDFGRISIFGSHSLVELPEDLPGEVFERLEETRISGQLINLERDTGRPPRDRDRDNYRDRGRGHRDDRRGGHRRHRDDRRGGYRDRDDRRGGYRDRDDRRGGYRDRDDRRGGHRDRRDRDDRRGGNRDRRDRW